MNSRKIETTDEIAPLLDSFSGSGKVTGQNIKGLVETILDLIEEGSLYEQDGEYYVPQDNDGIAYAWPLTDFALACDTDAAELDSDEIAKLEALGITVRG